MGYFAFDSQEPYTKLIPRVSPTNSNKKIRGRTIMRWIYLSPSDTRPLCGGLTDGQNGGKLCHMKSCKALKYRKLITVSLLPCNDYLMLLGSHIFHPFPLICYKYFTEVTIHRLVPDFGGWSLDTDPNFSRYWHFCGTIINIRTDRNRYKRITMHHPRKYAVHRLGYILKGIIDEGILVLKKAQKIFFC